MSFFSKIGTAVRAVNEGRSTAQAQSMAEAFLGTRLPLSVAEHGFQIVAPMAPHSSVETMAAWYISLYADYMQNEVAAAEKIGGYEGYRKTIYDCISSALQCVAEKQGSSSNFHPTAIVRLIASAQRWNVDTNCIKTG